MMVDVERDKFEHTHLVWFWVVKWKSGGWLSLLLIESSRDGRYSQLRQGYSIIQGLVYINQGLNYINQTLNYINQTLVYRLRVTWRSLQASKTTFAPLYLTFQLLSRCSESFDTFLLRSRVLHLMDESTKCSLQPSTHTFSKLISHCSKKNSNFARK